MRLRKTLLVFLVLAGSLFILPAKAEELPTIDIIQLENGDIKVSSERETVIKGFVSLSFTNETTEVVLLPQDVIADDTDLVFLDPGLNDDFVYVFVYNENEIEVTLSGSISLSTAEEGVEIVHFNSAFDHADLETPYFSYIGMNGKMLLVISNEDKDVEFEVLYSTKKNGKYKKVENYNYETGTYYEPDDGVYYDASTWYGYINKVKVGKKYYIKARSYKVVGGQNIYSGWGKYTAKFKTGSVKNVVARLTSPDKLSVSWKKAKKAKKYYVYVDGFLAGTRALYNDFVSHGGDPLDFNWSDYYEGIADPTVKKTSYTFDVSSLDMTLPVDIFITLQWGFGSGAQYYSAVFDDEFCKPVQNINVAASSNKKQVEFTFESALDVTKYQMKRRDFGGKFGTVVDPSLMKAIKLDKAAFDGILVPDYENSCLYDFNLFVATKKNGTYKRVKTTADFSDPHNLKLTYKAKRGKTLYYKILPTVESINNREYLYPVLYDKTNISYYTNLVNPVEIISFKLPK